MAKNVNQILKKVLLDIKPSIEEVKSVNGTLNDFLAKVKLNIKAKKISAEVFVGGSAAKGTLIKKDRYDIDIFIRFDKKYKNEELSELTAKILHGFKVERVHGSRDYFKIQAGKGLSFEIVPVRKVQNPKEAENITDLSYSHVNYIKKKIKNQNIIDDIMIAKAFCHGAKVYGAESYIRGFSGYAIELLVYKYGGFLKFLQAMTKVKDKLVIDIERHHKSSKQVLMDINGAKLGSPVILIDPTYKQRNVLAALSEETFGKFQVEAKKFLSNPSPEAFEEKIINVEKLRTSANSGGYDFAMLEVSTHKQAGDIAGTKLWKFHRHIEAEVGKMFDIKKHEFEYNQGHGAKFVLIAKPKKEILISGPRLEQEKHVKRFKQAHKNSFVKNKRLYAKIKPETSLKEFIHGWIAKNKKRMQEMSVSEMKII